MGLAVDHSGSPAGIDCEIEQDFPLNYELEIKPDELIPRAAEMQPFFDFGDVYLEESAGRYREFRGGAGGT